MPKYPIRVPALKICTSLAVLMIGTQTAVCAQYDQHLKGRIEKIFVDGKSIIKEELKARAEKFDLNRIKQKNKPRILNAKLKTFPAKLRGEWKGKLKITRNSHNPVTGYDPDAMESKLTKVGKYAYAHFRFYTPKANKIVMATPIVKLPYPNQRNRFAYLPMFDPNTGAVARPPSGAQNWVSLDQSQDIKARLLTNDVKYLGNQKVEQYVVVKHMYIDKKTKKMDVYISEYIYQFEKTGPFQLKVKLATIDYDEKLVWQNKLLFEGTVN